MAEVKFLQLSPGWQKKHLKMHQIDALKYGILKNVLRGSMPPDPPRGVKSFSPFTPLTHFHACLMTTLIKSFALLSAGVRAISMTKCHKNVCLCVVCVCS